MCDSDDAGQDLGEKRQQRGRGSQVIGTCGRWGSVTWTCQAAETPSRGRVEAPWSLGAVTVSPIGLHGRLGKTSRRQSWRPRGVSG